MKVSPQYKASTDRKRAGSERAIFAHHGFYWKLRGPAKGGCERVGSKIRTMGLAYTEGIQTGRACCLDARCMNTLF